MSHIFRLHKEGDSTINDWGNSQKYGSQVIEKIEDPNGESSAREITSIPSPFARIDLVKTAYAKVVEMSKKTKSLNGDTIHHKMVSDSLDVGQLFFEFDKHRDKLQILVWDKKKDLEALQQSDNPAHQLLGETYRIYMQQDGDVYNFPLMDRMYLLNFTKNEYDTAEVNIIGATSPATLFFTSANDLNYVTRNIQFSNDNPDRPFDDDFCPLHKRDIEYLKFLWTLKASIPNFSTLFKEVDAYMTASFLLMDVKKKKILQDVTIANLDDFSDISVGDNAGHSVEVLTNVKLKQSKADVGNIEKESGFVINTDKNPFDGHKPLVLPVDMYTHNTLYTKTNRWNKDTKVPYKDPIPLDCRTLPDEGSKYPYLTISDFLTDTIVRMPYEINKDSFFDGNINRADGKSYLLPLTNLFFQYFTAEQLYGNTKDGKKMFELKSNAGGVTAFLRIPVKNNQHIEYRRTYFEEIAPNIEKNDGTLIEHKFGLGVMPLIRFPENVQKHYRIAMFDKGKDNAVLTCMDSNNTFIETKQVIRAKKDLSRRGCSHESYIVEENFDHIQVEIGNNNKVNGYIIPKFKKEEGNAQYTFAVDFGTTNTHIEYSTNTKPSPEAFHIKANECQLHKFHKHYTDPDIRMGFVQEFIPDTIGDHDMFSFPMRTVFAQHKNIKYDQSPMPLADGHIPFLYEKDFTPDWNDIKTELKWGGVHERLLEMHLETIFILMRNKVVLNGGDLQATKVIWFYPASMTEAKVNQFKKNWKNAYQKYFGNKFENVISISESMAPYNHFVTTQGAAPEVVTIDIGGGTTDVFIVEREEPKMLMSFRYASNAIFGDGYNSNPNQNGFVKTYKKYFEEVLKNNRLEELSQALTQIELQNKSSDIIAFLFSLIGDKVKNNPELNFLQKLSNNDRLKYVFIVFYASILYFIAKSMKAKGLMKPKTLAFSGNGSNSLRIVSDEKNIIERFAKLIFDGVYGDNKGSLQVIMETNPKIATCKGGIEIPVAQDYDTIDNIKTIIVGNDLNTFSDKKLTYADIKPEVENGVVQSVHDFFVFLFDLHKDNNDFLSNKLGADPAIFHQVKEFCLGEEGKQLKSVSMFKGLKNKRQEVNNETKLEETLFFYPFVGILHDLALEISEMK